MVCVLVHRHDGFYEVWSRVVEELVGGRRLDDYVHDAVSPSRAPVRAGGDAGVV